MPGKLETLRTLDPIITAQNVDSPIAIDIAKRQPRLPGRGVDRIDLAMRPGAANRSLVKPHLHVSLNHEHAFAPEQRGLQAVMSLKFVIDHDRLPIGRSAPRKLPQSRPFHRNEFLLSVSIEIDQASAFAEV